MSKLPVRVLNRAGAERRTPLPGEVCISVFNPRQSPSQLEGWADVLRLGFHDTDRRGGGFTVMSLADADRVLAFCQQHRDAPLTVHCEFGASRSVAIALFVALWLQRPLLLLHDVLAPNSWVLRQLSVAALYRGFRHLDFRLLSVALGDKCDLAPQVVPAAIAETFKH